MRRRRAAADDAAAGRARPAGLRPGRDRRARRPVDRQRAQGLPGSQRPRGHRRARRGDHGGALARWDDIAATRVVRIPESWGRDTYRAVPEEPEDQAKMDRLGYASIDERLAERFHTTVEVLHALNPGGRPAGTTASRIARAPRPHRRPSPSAASGAEQPPRSAPASSSAFPTSASTGSRARRDDDADWLRTLASLGVGADQPEAARIVVDKSDGSLKAYDEAGKLVALFTVTTGSSHDPLPLGEWGINGVVAQPAVRLRSGPVLGRARPRGKAAASAGAERAGRRGVDRPHARALRHPRHARAARRSAAPRATAACA